ncbi:MAG: glycosyltransferase family 4 protein [Acidobacteria bacterium]|nr:glycosyltransferase family 4 protein [Acidobacteriota bacterium]
MRIAIDTVPLLLRSAGVKTYVYYWVEHLLRQAGENRVELFPLLDGIRECVHERSVAGPLRTYSGIALLQAANYLGDFVLEPMARRIDLFHHSSQQLRRPPRGCLLTATIYDMTCWLVPDMHSAANVRANRQFAEHVLKRAAGMIAISASSRQDAARILGLDAARIEVIYPGVAPAFFDYGAERTAAATRKLGLAKPYALFVGTVEPRKNVGVLLEAWEHLPADMRDEFDLVIAGPAGWGDGGVLDRLRSGIPGVRYLGYVAESDMPGLNAGASLFVYPSLYEGFGLPVAQAMAAGIPVITSNLSSLPEVAGDAGLLVDPRSPAELRAALEKLLPLPDLRRGLGNKGRERARQFRWELCAEKSWRFFRTVTGE